MKPQIKAVVRCLLAALALWFFFRYLLGWFAPIIAAYLIASIIEPAVHLLSDRAHMPRPLASALCGVTLIGVMLTIPAMVLASIVSELSAFTEKSPDLLKTITIALERLTQIIGNLIESAPPPLSAYIFAAIESLPEQAAQVVGGFSSRILTWLTSAAGKTPDILMFTITCLLGLYFISAEYPDIKQSLKKLTPALGFDALDAVVRDTCTALFSWLKAQLVLMAAAFAVLLMAFMFIRIDYALLTAIAVAAFDALPVLGAGIILLPWAAISALYGNPSLAPCLVVTYCAVMLVKNLIQPKLLSSSLGLHPVTALALGYAGLCTYGIRGMIVAPLIAVVVMKAWQPQVTSGYSGRSNAV